MVGVVLWCGEVDAGFPLCCYKGGGFRPALPMTSFPVSVSTDTDLHWKCWKKEKKNSCPYLCALVRLNNGFHTLLLWLTSLLLGKIPSAMTNESLVFEISICMNNAYTASACSVMGAGYRPCPSCRQKPGFFLLCPAITILTLNGLSFFINCAFFFLGDTLEKSSSVL